MDDIYLGVNVDHVATVRQARGGIEPDPVTAAVLCEQSGADGITVHLREDRRHIQDRDVALLSKLLQTRMNLEMAVTNEMTEIALATKPNACCLVPEKRQELTTEGGLDVAGQLQRVADVTRQLKDEGIKVSLFIDPDPKQIEASAEVKADIVELHTGCYAESNSSSFASELERLQQGATQANSFGLIVHAGHGLNYHKVKPVAAIPVVEELNIGHALIARSLFVGLPNAVAEMKRLMLEAR
ncbi:MAG: pyridoxine 5'-phosphate synthase [Pseudomonadota bacterium]